MSGLALALRQVRFENRAFWRNPPAAFFTFAFPLLFMFIFNVLFGADAARFFTPAIIVFSVVTATFTNLAMNITFARDAGVLKRIRGTPLPAWSFLAGRIGHAVGVTILLVAIVAAVGAILYDVPVPWDAIGVLVLVLAVAAASFSALGLAVAGIMPNADAAPAIVNAIVLPVREAFDQHVLVLLGDPVLPASVVEGPGGTGGRGSYDVGRADQRAAPESRQAQAGATDRAARGAGQAAPPAPDPDLGGRRRRDRRGRGRRVPDRERPRHARARRRGADVHLHPRRRGVEAEHAARPQPPDDRHRRPHARRPPRARSR